MRVYTKPTMWCLCCHYVAWDELEDNPEYSYCKYCKRTFKYPTKIEDNPVYKK